MGAVVLAATAALLISRERETADLADAASVERGERFEHIYAGARWGRNDYGQGGSGYGSTLEFTLLYRVFLQQFLAAHEIRSVVDAGCGDWQFSKAIDWTGIDYLGVDIVPAIIEANQRRYGAPRVHFARADIVQDELPPADLLIVKDVLQHLSNADIKRFLPRLRRYRHVLIVNDVQPDTLTAPSVDIPTGGYRPIDLTQPPFGLQGDKLMVWRHGGATKLVLHVRPAQQ